MYHTFNYVIQFKMFLTYKLYFGVEDKDRPFCVFFFLTFNFNFLQLVDLPRLETSSAKSLKTKKKNMTTCNISRTSSRF